MKTIAYYESNEVIRFVSVTDLSKRILLSGNAAHCSSERFNLAKQIAMEKTTSQEAKSMLESVLVSEFKLHDYPKSLLIDSIAFKEAMTLALSEENMHESDSKLIRESYMFNVKPIGIPPRLLEEEQLRQVEVKKNITKNLEPKTLKYESQESVKTAKSNNQTKSSFNSNYESQDSMKSSQSTESSNSKSQFENAATPFS